MSEIVKLDLLIAALEKKLQKLKVKREQMFAISTILR